MKKLLIAATALSGFLALTNVANAADPIVNDPGHNWYVSVFGGYAIAEDYDFTLTDNVGAGIGTEFPYDISLDDGFVIGGAIGMVFNENIRFDVEVAHSENEFGDTLNSATLGPFTTTDGDLQITTILANVWLNANMDIVDPYVGGGVGIGFVDGDLTVLNGVPTDVFDGSDVGFAAQVGAGLRFPVSDSFEIDVGYRLRAVFDVELDSAIAGFDNSAEDFYTHSFQVGVNITF
jgi:OOP family OmpA-OmpF porin